MEVTILAFGVSKELTGASKLILEVEKGINTRTLKKELESRYPQLASLKSYMIAVNKEYAGDALILNAEDEIAIIPPVSGG
jgi:molybdopterin synthase sulfur carrier subunit